MLKEEIKDIIKRETEAISQIPVDENYQRALDIIYESVHNKQGKLVISGMGKAGHTAISLSTTLSATGTPAVFLHPSDAQHGDLGVIQPNDALLLISNSGKTREIIELYDLAKNLYKQLPVILITGNADSVLSALADVTVLTGQPKEVCTLGLAPTTSSTVMTVISDILIVMMEKRINFSNTEYAKRHHGGYLGEKSRKASKDEQIGNK